MGKLVNIEIQNGNLRVKTDEGLIVLDIHSDEAQQVLSGYALERKDGKMSVSKSKTGFDLLLFKTKLEAKTATIDDIQDFLLEKFF